MKRFTLVLLALAACGDNQPGRVGEIVVAECGAAPPAPATSIAYDDAADTATMSATQAHALDAWRWQLGTWLDCVYALGIPDAGTGAP